MNRYLILHILGWEPRRTVRAERIEDVWKGLATSHPTYYRVIPL